MRDSKDPVGPEPEETISTSHREVLLTTAVNVEEIVRGLRPAEQPAADAGTAVRELDTSDTGADENVAGV